MGERSIRQNRFGQAAGRVNTKKSWSCLKNAIIAFSKKEPASMVPLGMHVAFKAR